jgi:hypothetical protein
VQGNYPKEKFVSVSGSAAVWNKAEGKIKEAVNGAG